MGQPTGPRPATAGQRPVTGAQPATGARPPTELENLRAWVGSLDRKLGLRTYLILASSLLALACSIVAVVLALDARDNAASADDIAKVEQEVAALQGTATAGATDTAAADTTALSDQLASLQKEVDGLSAGQDATDKRVSVIEDDIDDLRSQISDLGGSSP